MVTSYGHLPVSETPIDVGDTDDLVPHPLATWTLRVHLYTFRAVLVYQRL